MSRINVVAIVPEDLRADANDLAMVLAEGPADAATYTLFSWENEAGRYALRDVLVRPEWLALAQGALARPAWDDTQHINMTGAARAQDAIALWAPPDGDAAPAPLPMPAPGRLVVIVGLATAAAIAALGLARIPETD